MLLQAITLAWTLLVQADPDRLIVFHAGSLAAPLEQVEKEFRRLNPAVDVRREGSGSREAARKVSDLNREADIVAVSDYKVIEEILIPKYASWSIIFARNHMVIAYTGKSRFADEITPSNWFRILLREGVEYGRADPEKDPCGYRTLMVWQLAEKHYGEPGLYKKLLKGCPQKNIRPKEVDIVALQEAGDLDYHFQYLSVAEQHGLKYLRLPSQIDLGSWHHRDVYSGARIELKGRLPGEKVTMTGEPILYAITILKNAPHTGLAKRFLQFLLGPDGKEIFERMGQEALTPYLAVNIQNVPDELRSMVVPIESEGDKRPRKAPSLLLRKGMAALDIYKNGRVLKRLTYDEIASLPPARDPQGKLNPAWDIRELVTSVDIPLNTIKKITVTGARGETLNIFPENLQDPSAKYIMGYNRKKLIRLKILQKETAREGGAGHSPDLIRQVNKVEIFVPE